MQYEQIEYVLKKGKNVLKVSQCYEDVKRLQFLQGGEITKVKVVIEK